MAYRVFPTTNPKKPNTPKFKVRWEVQKKGELPQRHVPQSEWTTIGIRPDMSFEEAKEICKHINSKEKLKYHEERRNKIA